MSPRDSQRQRIYDAEAKAFNWEVNRQYDPEQAQEYVNQLLAQRWVRARWGKRSIEVRCRNGWGGARAHGSRLITIDTKCPTQKLLLHEVAHCLDHGNGHAGHGPEYAGIMLTLVRREMGAKLGDALRDSYRKQRVRISMKGIPKPTKQVATQASARAERLAAAKVPLTEREARVAARYLRRAVASGAFGPSGRKPRVHALEVERQLEAG